MSKTLPLTDPSASELYGISQVGFGTLSRKLRDEIDLGLGVPGGGGTTGPVFPTSVPGFNRIITRTFDMATSDFGQDFLDLTTTDLIIIASKGAGQPGWQGQLSTAPYPGTIPDQQRTITISTVGGNFAVPYPWILSGGITFAVGPGIPGLLPGLTVGTWYYFNVKSTTGPPCGMRISINRPRPI